LGDGGRGPKTFALDTDGGKPEPLTSEGYHCYGLTPDGLEAICRTARGRVLYSFETREESEIPGLDPGDQFLRWSADGKSLYVQPGDDLETAARIYRIEIATGERKLLHQLGPFEHAGLVPHALWAALTPDGGAYCYTATYFPNDLYLVEGLR
jgi:hypothetical protein